MLSTAPLLPQESGIPPMRIARQAPARRRGLDWARVAALTGALLAHVLGFGAFWLAMNEAAPLRRPSAPALESTAESLSVSLSPLTAPLEAPPEPPPSVPPPPILLQLRKPPPPPPAAALVAAATEPAPAPPTAAPQWPSVAPSAPLAAAPAATVSAPAAPSLDPAAARDARKDYVRALMAALLAQRSYPAEARRQRARGVVAVRFTLDRQGHVLASSIARSPGFEVLEQAALEVLRRADPLPPIPTALGVDRITVTVPIEYSLITR